MLMSRHVGKIITDSHLRTHRRENLKSYVTDN
jgi:hypothetical protein